MTAPGGRRGFLALLATTLVALVPTPGRTLAAAAADAVRPPPPEHPATLGRRVLLVTPELGGDVAAAVVTRLRGELRAARFELDLLTIPNDAPRRSTVEEAASHGGATAALGIFFGGGRVEMWAADASAGRTLMQNLPLDAGTPERRAAVVAVKAVDLLKAMLADIWTPPPAPPGPAIATAAGPSNPSTPTTTTATTTATSAADTLGIASRPSPPASAGDRFDVTAGLGWLQASGASGWAPLVALSSAFGARGRLGFRFTGSALGHTADVNGSAGSAQLAQQIGIAELLAWSHEWHRLRGLLAIGAGGHHLSVDGHGMPGFSGVSHDVWSLATTAGAGIAMDPLPRLMVALDARAVETWPATTVQIDGTRTARLGRPSVWLALAAGVRFP